jgi:hypothetical protein
MRFATASLLVGAVAAGGLDWPSASGWPSESAWPSVSGAPTGKWPPPPSSTISIVWETQEVTVTSCPPEITDCPAESVVVETSVVARTTTICPVEESESAEATAWAPSTWAPASWASSSCAESTETCTVTVTRPKSWATGGSWPTQNATKPAGTG